MKDESRAWFFASLHSNPPESLHLGCPHVLGKEIPASKLTFQHEKILTHTHTNTWPAPNMEQRPDSSKFHGCSHT